MKNINVLCACLFLSSAVAFAQDIPESRTAPEHTGSISENKPHVGFMLGAADSTADDDANTGVGLDIGYQPYVPVSVGLELSDINTQTNLLAKILYNFSGDNVFIRNSYAGGAIGSVADNAAVGPVIGFDIPLNSETTTSKTFSLGANAKYLFVEHDEQVSSLNGIVKYWF